MMASVYASIGPGTYEMTLLVALAGGGGGILLLCAVLVPLQAYRRGHGFISWFCLQFLAFNPVYPMLLIALLPNKAKVRKREQYAAELDDKLAASGYTGPAAETLSARIERSLGDLPTIDPVLRSVGDRPTRTAFRSLGELPTQDPPDAPTRSGNPG